MADFSDRLSEQLPRLRRYARALTGNRDSADDLVQDTVERALNKAALWRPGGRLDAWLMTLMHNVFVNQRRGGSGRVDQASEPIDTLPVEPAVRAMQTDAIEVRDLHTALAQLPVEQREVLLLVALEEYAYEEAAQILGIPVGTVMSRLARARARLRLLLEGHAAPPSLKVVK